MRLADFVLQNPQAIIAEWESFARNLSPSHSDMTPLALRDHIKEILAFIVEDMSAAQTRQEQIEKSHGEGSQNQQPTPSAAETHASLRLAGGFNMEQMVSEYRALRASVTRLWLAETPDISANTLSDMVRFNEAIDQAATESIIHYEEKLGEAKDLFLGILTHDLRNPLGAMVGAAQLIPMIGPLNARQHELSRQINESGQRISEIVTHLLDITKTRLGSGLPVIPAPMNMGFLARQLVDEMRALHPARVFTLDITGSTDGEWDKARLAQVFSNLMGNAVQYGFRDTAINVVLRGLADDVVLSVHNEGMPIPVKDLGRIFESLIRSTGEATDASQMQSSNLGLGLYITQQIVVAHGGTMDVRSSEAEGTTFTARFPRVNANRNGTPGKGKNGGDAGNGGGDPSGKHALA